MKRTRELIYSISLLSGLFMSPSVDAQVPMKAYKKVTKYFKRGKEYLSPVLGKTALEAGLIHDIRFYDALKPGIAEGTRSYIRDSSNDPFWKLSKTFFPSPAGHLAASTGEKNNLGRFATPATVAQMLNFAAEVRKFDDEVTTIQAAQPDLAKELNLLYRERVALSPKTDKKKKGSPRGDEDFKPRYDLDTTLAKIAEGEKQLEAIKTAVSSKEEVLNQKKAGFLKALSASLSREKLGDAVAQEHMDELLDAEIAKLPNHENFTMEEVVAKRGEIKAAKLTADAQWGKLSDEELRQGVSAKLSRVEGATLTPLINNIDEAIRQEKSSLHPQYTTEQVISAFFGELFNTRADVGVLLSHLDDEIVDKKLLKEGAFAFSENDLLTREDLDEILKHETFDIDDIYALLNASVFGRLTPYKPGVSLLSNGDTYSYDRKTNTYIRESIFADCVEMGGRHLMNMLLYNDETGLFDLSKLKANIDPANPYFANFEAFYQKQLPNDANNGDITMRSAWNAVMGDLNAFDKSIPVIYRNGYYELHSGFINLVRVFQKIFGLTLDELPKDNFAQKVDWVKKGLMKILSTANPDRQYQLDLSGLEEIDSEISGTVPITVLNKDGAELFTFDFYSEWSNKHKHSEIRDLKELKVTDAAALREHVSTHENTLHKNTSEESLWLLDPSPQGKVSLPFYQLFTEPLTDNNSLGRALTSIGQNFETWQQKDPAFKGKLRALAQIIENILNDISWEDDETLGILRPKLMALLNHKDLVEPVVKVVLANVIDQMNRIKEEGLPLAYVNKLLGLVLEQYDIWKQTGKLYENSKQQLQDGLRRVLDIVGDNPKYVGEISPALKKLSEREEFKDIILSKVNQVLDTHKDPNDYTDYSGYGARFLLDFYSVKNLSKRIESLITKLNLESSQDYESAFDHLTDFANLRQLSLGMIGKREVSIKDIEGLEALYVNYEPKDKVEIVDLPNLQNIGFNKNSVGELNLKNLKKLTETKYWELDRVGKLHLENLPALEKLELHTGAVKQLGELSLKNLARVTDINLRQSTVTKIEGLEEVPNLKKVDLYGAENLDELTIKGHKVIEEMHLDGTRIKKLTIEDTPSLGYLIMNNQTRIKELYLKNVGIESSADPEFIEYNVPPPLDKGIINNMYLENLNKTEKFNFMFVKSLKKIVFAGTFDLLKEIAFPKSEELVVEGLEELMARKKEAGQELKIINMPVNIARPRPLGNEELGDGQ